MNAAQLTYSEVLVHDLTPLEVSMEEMYHTSLLIAAVVEGEHATLCTQEYVLRTR